MIKHKLPGDPAVLGMGITSVLFIFFLSEFILFAFAALGLGFVGVSKAADNLGCSMKTLECSQRKAGKM